ncbi:MAG: hypothetical protein IJS53_03630, partial [Clostridia bacterium]|nr:hypothetical protein [Clostridia bacterium]
MGARSVWDARDIRALCEERRLCPFEFSLALSEVSDVVVCDYNYVFDPTVMLRRVIGRKIPVTLLIDEAHGLPSRVRDMLSAALDTRELSALRRETGRLHGRKSTLYAALTAFLHALREAGESSIPALSAPLTELIAVMAHGFDAPQAEGFGDQFRQLLQFSMALERFAAQPQDYRPLLEGTKRDCRLTLLCLEVSAHIGEIARRMDGAVFFSATLSP